MSAILDYNGRSFCGFIFAQPLMLISQQDAISKVKDSVEQIGTVSVIEVNE